MKIYLIEEKAEEKAALTPHFTPSLRMRSWGDG
jgi:hypothetical protein